jgi:hypothetical protein
MTETLARWLVRLALRWPKAVVLCGLTIAVCGVLLASRLSLQTDLSELLPADAPSVTALHALNKRVGGTGNVSIAVESPSGREALRAYVPKLVAELRRELGPDLLSIRYTRKDLEDFYKKYAAYYVSLADLQKWQNELATALAKQNPAYVDLEDNDKDRMRELADEVRASKDKLDPHAKMSDPESGILMTEGGHLSVVFVRPASDALNLAGGGGVLDKIRHAVDATHPAEAGVKILGYTGSIPVALTEISAIKRDIVSTALFVIFGVGLIVFLYFKGVRELFLMSGAVTVGAAIALGFAEVWIGHVNAQTAFLGAIIVGTGINYGIIFLDRYRQARVRDQAFEDALYAACEQTLRATGIAALATAVSFGVLAAGEVESFHQFGWIGGIGILACWVATFTLVPAVCVLADRHRQPRTPPGYRFISAGFAAIARGCERAPKVVVGGTLAIAAACLAIAVVFAQRGGVIESDLRKLGTKSSEQSGIEKLDNRLRGMDDHSASPQVIVTDDASETRPVCDLLNERARTDLKNVLIRCYSLDDLFPRDLDRRTPLMGKLAHDLDAVDEDTLDAKQRDDLAELRRALAERPPEYKDLPPELSEAFTERDGSVGRLAFVDPHDEHIEANLYRLTDAIRSIHLPSGKVLQSSGELVVFADVLRAMRRDATKLTIAAALLVLFVLGAVTRRLGTFLRVGGALVAGVAVMAGVAVLLGQKLNFFNFVALPTTFGIGIDYAINIEERIRQKGRAALAEAVAESGPAVVLASMTSVIGYGSLLPADSRALASFGALAIIGELACVVVAVIFVPALWATSARREP